MTRETVVSDYFSWLYNLVCGKRYSKQISFEKLLLRLHDTEFRYIIPRDENRAGDGTSLRWRFVCDRNYREDYEVVLSYLSDPCSVLEMMIALAIHCEENIMDDPSMGDRTGQWFWGMIVNLGLGSMTDDRYDEDYIDEVVNRFLDREYEPDGKGGLFTIRNCEYDLRTVEIWYQLCWYLNNLV